MLPKFKLKNGQWVRADTIPWLEIGLWLMGIGLAFILLAGALMRVDG